MGRRWAGSQGTGHARTVHPGMGLTSSILGIARSLGSLDPWDRSIYLMLASGYRSRSRWHRLRVESKEARPKAWSLLRPHHAPRIHGMHGCTRHAQVSTRWTRNIGLTSKRPALSARHTSCRRLTTTLPTVRCRRCRYRWRTGACVGRRTCGDEWCTEEPSVRTAREMSAALRCAAR